MDLIGVEFDTMEEIEKLKLLRDQFKEVGKLKKDFEQLNKDMHFVKELKEIIDESKKEQNQKENIEYV